MWPRAVSFRPAGGIERLVTPFSNRYRKLRNFRLADRPPQLVKDTSVEASAEIEIVSARRALRARNPAAAPILLTSGWEPGGGGDRGPLSGSKQGT